MSNNEIIQALQREGYNSDTILDGMNQADLKTNVEGQNQGFSGEQMQQQYQQSEQGDPQGGMDQGQSFSPNQAPLQGQTGDFQNSMPPPQEMPPPMDSSSTMANNGLDQVTFERIEEIAEAIIDEKWNEIVKSINKIIDWKERTEGQINKIEQKFDDIKKDFDNLNKGVLGKIGEYDKNIGNLGVEIKAMERVFQKIIPTMTENVHALEKITKKLDDSDDKKDKKSK